jgi:hypothetical protein
MHRSVSLFDVSFSNQTDTFLSQDGQVPMSDCPWRPLINHNNQPGTIPQSNIPLLL